MGSWLSYGVRFSSLGTRENLVNYGDVNGNAIECNVFGLWCWDAHGCWIRHILWFRNRWVDPISQETHSDLGCTISLMSERFLPRLLVYLST